MPGNVGVPRMMTMATQLPYSPCKVWDYGEKLQPLKLTQQAQRAAGPPHAK